MSFDHRLARSNPSVMLSLDDPEWTLHKTTQIHDQSLSTALIDVNSDNEAASGWVMHLDTRGVQDRNDGTGTDDGANGNSTVAGSKPQAKQCRPK